MGLIFFLSAQPDLSSGLGTLDVVLRKILHMTEYALLCFLWWRALRTTTIDVWRALVLAFAVSVGYAATDEYHQTLVRGRHGAPLDVGIDAVGAAAAAIVVRRRR
jgi:VanZ family protein